MHEEDKQKIIQRYRNRVEQHSHGAAALGEPKNRQAFYFSGLLRADGFTPDDSLLDIGCGYGDLRSFLQSKGWRGKYTGIDINPELVAEGRRRYPDAVLLVQDIQKENPREVFDWCASFGVLTSKTEKVSYLDHADEMLGLMWESCHKGLVFNILSPLADYTHTVHTRPAFADVLKIISKLTNRFTIYHDYMPFEYLVCAYKDNEINRDLLIFSTHNDSFNEAVCQWKKVNDIVDPSVKTEISLV